VIAVINDPKILPDITSDEIETEVGEADEARRNSDSLAGAGAGAGVAFGVSLFVALRESVL
jgi:hypothetical protein